MKKVMSVLPFALLVSANQAWSQEESSNPDGIYLGLTALQLSTSNDEALYDDKDIFLALGLLGFQAGYRFNENLRADVEASRIAGDNDAVIDHIYRFTLNGYYDFGSPDQTVVPYAGGGIGAGIVDIDGENENELTLHAEAGVAFNVTPSIAVVPAYRYSWVGDSGDGAIDEHSIRLTGRYSF